MKGAEATEIKFLFKGVVAAWLKVKSYVSKIKVDNGLWKLEIGSISSCVSLESLDLSF